MAWKSLALPVSDLDRIWCVAQRRVRWSFRQARAFKRNFTSLYAGVQSAYSNYFLFSWSLYGFSLPWRLQPRWSLRTFIFPFSASARTSYSSTYHSSDIIAWNRDGKWVTNSAMLAIKVDLPWDIWRKVWATRSYLEATDLIINLSNQPMEELGVIKSWCTLLKRAQQM